MQDPHGAACAGAFVRNEADDQKHDATFPGHPLGKMRVSLNEPVSELGVAPGIRKGRPFRFKKPKRSLWQRLPG